MKKILVLVLVIVGCEEPEANNLIDLEFVVIKSFQQLSSSALVSPQLSCSQIECEDGNEPDCACVCDGSAIEQTYYWDNDGDGLGSDLSYIFCSATNLDDKWVLNSDDDDDTTPVCFLLYTLDILEEDLVITNGNLVFSHNNEDYSVDVSSCVETMISKLTRIIQDTELKILYVYEDSEEIQVSTLSYESPNELLYVK